MLHQMNLLVSVYVLICFLRTTLTDNINSTVSVTNHTDLTEFYAQKLLETYGDGQSLGVAQLEELIDRIKTKAEKYKPHSQDEETNPSTGSCNSTVDRNSTCQADKCLTAAEMFHFHGLANTSRVELMQFKDMTPMVLYQAQNDHCKSSDDKPRAIKPGDNAVWGLSFLCVTLINLCSLMGLFFLPLMRRSFYQTLLMFMVALAVGTLTGSSLLFLIPSCFRFNDEGNPYYHSYVWKCTTILGGIYLFFVVERLLKNIMDWRRRLENGNSEELDHLTDVPCHLPTAHADDVELEAAHKLIDAVEHVKDGSNQCYQDHDGHNPENHHHDNHYHENQPQQSQCQLSSVRMKTVDRDQALNVSFRPLSDITAKQSPTTSPSCDTMTSDLDLISAEGRFAKTLLDQGHNQVDLLQATDMKGGAGDRISKTPSVSSHEKKGRIKSVAWMVIFGDGLHNFIDGLSIGAAFAQSTMGGISISLAVICEELPHELGDFAILLNSGMSMRQALTFNFLSACMCYLGTAVGILVGEMTMGSQWIFALAGGMFLYISLVDMLPEVNHEAEKQAKTNRDAWRLFFLQNCGLLMGYSIMLILANFAHYINLDS